MIITNDDRVEALLRGESVERIRDADLPALRDALHILNAASRLEDTLFVGRRTIRVITDRRRSYYVDTGSEYWITFQWRVHDAINVQIVRLRSTSLGSEFRR
jgi:plasmid maintenance system killer protein